MRVRGKFFNNLLLTGNCLASDKKKIFIFKVLCHYILREIPGEDVLSITRRESGVHGQPTPRPRPAVCSESRQNKAGCFKHKNIRSSNILYRYSVQSTRPEPRHVPPPPLRAERESHFPVENDLRSLSGRADRAGPGQAAPSGAERANPTPPRLGTPNGAGCAHFPGCQTRNKFRPRSAAVRPGRRAATRHASLSDAWLHRHRAIGGRLPVRGGVINMQSG